MLTRRKALVSAGALLSTGVPFAAQSRPKQHLALLIGVGQVDALPAARRLLGPANDVALMHEVLIASGLPSSAVTELVTGGLAPTAEAVAGAMRAIEDSAGSGAKVVFYYAGHGTQVPQAASRRAMEADGLEEVLLLADVQRWRGTALDGELPNALRDEHLAAWVGRLAARGANVWVFIDACHAAGMVRGTSALTAGEIRAVQATELGVPPLDWRAASRLGRASSVPAYAVPSLLTRPVALERRVFALAARAQEAAAEGAWRLRGGGRSAVHGAFTYCLASALRETRIASVADLRYELDWRMSQLSGVDQVAQVMGDRRLRWRG